MLYHVIRRPLQTNSTTSSKSSRPTQRSGSVPTPKLMPRYHYSRINSTNGTNNSDTLIARNNIDEQITKPTMTATTTANNTNQNSYGSYRSTFMPFVTNNRTTTANKREFIQIPVTREDGTSVTPNSQVRTIPITFIEEITALPSTTTTITNNENGNVKPNFTNVLRPNSKFYLQNSTNQIEESSPITSSVPRLPSVSRRLSLTIPVMTTTVTTNTDDNDPSKSSNPSSSIRQIPIRLSQATTAASIPTNSSRISSAILQSSPISNALQRQKTDIGETSLSTPSLTTITNPQHSTFDLNLPSSNASPIRRAEVMAREAIQGIARLQQQRNNSTSDNNTRSPTLSRRVIINLKNNQSVLLDSHQLSPPKPPPIPSSARIAQRNNLYHIPVLHEIQIPAYPTTRIAEASLQSTSNNNNPNSGSFKNEFHMQIPVTITNSNNDQENQVEQINGKEMGRNIRERIPSVNNNANQTLKSILKRSSSRETVSRKNVSFVNV